MTTRLFTVTAALTMSFATSGTALSQGGALRFDGVDDVCTALDSQSDFDVGDTFTLEAWVQVDALQAGASFVGGQGLGGGTSWRIGASIGTPSRASMTVSTPLTSSATATGAVIAGPMWTHYAGSFDGSNMTLYVDGILVTTSTHSNPGNASPVVALIMGRFPNVGSALHLEGALDEVRVWTDVRTPAEIQSFYNTTLTGNEQGLIGYYQFDEASGDVILDSSSRQNHGFLGLTMGAAGDDPARITSSAPVGPAVIGTNYCTAAPNSTGATGAISATGSSSAAANGLTLTASNVPPNQFGIFVTSRTQAVSIGAGGSSNGNLCLGGTLGRFNGPGQILSTGTSGEFSLTVDLTAVPLGPVNVSVMAGETLNFQGWHRDQVGLGSNFTDGLQIDFL